jgi:chaperonin GroES
MSKFAVSTRIDRVLTSWSGSWRRPTGEASFLENLNCRKKENRVMKLRPLQDRVIIKRLEEEEKTAGGIIIPDTAKEKPQQGRVVAVGKGKILENGQVTPPIVKEGDRVLFNKYAGTEVKIDGEEHLVMREDDILAIVQ